MVYNKPERAARQLKCPSCKGTRLCGVKGHEIRIEEHYNSDGSLRGIVKYTPRGCLMCGAFNWLRRFEFANMHEIDEMFDIKAELKPEIVGNSTVIMMLKCDAHERNYTTVSQFTRRVCKPADQTYPYLARIYGWDETPDKILFGYEDLLMEMLRSPVKREDKAS